MVEDDSASLISLGIITLADTSLKAVAEMDDDDAGSDRMLLLWGNIQSARELGCLPSSAECIAFCLPVDPTSISVEAVSVIVKVTKLGEGHENTRLLLSPANAKSDIHFVAEN